MRAEQVIERDGRTFVLYGGLLSLAHEQSGGRLRIETHLVQIPGPENGHVAICTATASMHDEAGVLIRSCAGIGDAAPDNVRRGMATALIRLSETRAKARALRDLTNAAEAVDEAEDDPREPEGPDAVRAAPTVGKRATPEAAAGKDPPARERTGEPAERATESQRRQLKALAEFLKRPLPEPWSLDEAGRLIDEWNGEKAARLRAATGGQS